MELIDNITRLPWNDPEKPEDVSAQICEHIASVYQENSPESIYFLMLYNIFNEFLDEIDGDVLPNDRTGYFRQSASRRLITRRPFMVF